MNNNVFLATTALDYFWDKDAEKGIFLGEWCKLYNKKKLYSKLNYNTLEYIWKDEQSIDSGIEYCDKVYQNILSKLVILLNEYHNVNENYRYWDILLKPWLLPYIQIIYDKYRHLELALKCYPSLYTYTIKKSQYQYTTTPNAFFQNIINSDEFNLQIYSQIINFLDIKNEEKNLPVIHIDRKIKIHSTIKEKIFRNISKILNRIFNKNNVLIVNPYFKHNGLKKIIQLSLQSKFLFSFDNFQYDIEIEKDIDLKSRDTVFSKVKGDSEFENLILELFNYDYPIIYLEAYKDFNKRIEQLPIYNSDIVYSANAIHSNNIFQFYIAKNNKKLKKLYGQHGGNIGMDKVNIPEIIEKSFAQVYYTFGWEEIDTKVLPHATFKLKYKKQKEIYFIMTAMPRYFYRFTFLEDGSKMINYIENSKKFLTNLHNINNITIRPYMGDYNWNIKERLLEVNKNLKFDNKTNYYKQLRMAKLVIFDHMHTGYLETLSANIPTIIIIPKDIYYFRDSAKIYIQLLKDVGILFEDPVEASKFVDEKYDNISSWWNGKELQKVRKEFCYQYARTSENWVNEWIVEFNRVLKN